MSDDDSSQGAGIAVLALEENGDDMNVLAHNVVDDIVQNILHDIVLKAHRTEKVARAKTAAILIEQKAAELEAEVENDSPAAESERKKIHVETSGAVYDNGMVLIKGNPLATTKEIRCSKCGLPRLLHPTDGNNARKPDPRKEYCKRHPYIEKFGHDIYGQPFPVEGPGKGHKKKKEAPLPEGEKPAATTFPNVKCHVCQRFLNVKRFAKHLEQCLGIRSRASGRAAMIKMNNGGGSTNGSTPNGSRRSTPIPGAKRSSPNKRESADFDDDEDTDESPKKKKPKKNLPKPKAPKMLKTTSQLSFEHKRSPEGDDERPVTAILPPKKKFKQLGGADKIVIKRNKGNHPSLSTKPSASSDKMSPVSETARNGEDWSESSQTINSP